MSRPTSFDVSHKDQKFTASQTASKWPLHKAGSHFPGEIFQYLIAALMAQGVIDGFKVVQIHTIMAPSSSPRSCRQVFTRSSKVLRYRAR